MRTVASVRQRGDRRHPCRHPLPGQREDTNGAENFCEREDAQERAAAGRGGREVDGVAEPRQRVFLCSVLWSSQAYMTAYDGSRQAVGGGAAAGATGAPRQEQRGAPRQEQRAEWC
jgi:hypothetical protein